MAVSLAHIFLHVHLRENHLYSCMTMRSFGEKFCDVVTSTQRLGVLGRIALGVQILYTFPTPKTGMKQIEQFNDIILRILRFLAESSGVTSWNSFNAFAIVNEVSAGVPTPPDSGKTPQLRTSKLAQNCGKTEILHLQPSYRICWSHEIETLPPI